MSLFPRRALGYFTRCTIDAALETRITESATTGLRHFQALTDLSQIANDLAGINIPHDSAARNNNVQVFA